MHLEQFIEAKEAWLAIKAKLVILQNKINQAIHQEDREINIAANVALFQQHILNERHRIIRPKVEDNFEFVIQCCLNLLIEVNRHTDFIIRTLGDI